MANSKARPADTTTDFGREYKLVGMIGRLMMLNNTSVQFYFLLLKWARAEAKNIPLFHQRQIFEKFSSPARSREPQRLTVEANILVQFRSQQLMADFVQKYQAISYKFRSSTTHFSCTFFVSEDLTFNINEIVQNIGTWRLAS